MTARRSVVERDEKGGPRFIAGPPFSSGTITEQGFHRSDGRRR